MSGAQDGCWHVGGASVRGPAHIRLGLPNQDAFAIHPPGGKGATIIAAVADGHGAGVHFRSDRGAELAVASAVELLERVADVGAAIDGAKIAHEIVESWRRKVEEDVRQQPLERATLDLYIPYGTTLLALLATLESVFALQIGDGEVWLGYRDDSVKRAIPPDTDLIGEQTRSLCMPDAAHHVKFSYARTDREEDLPTFALLTTDGTPKSFRSEEIFADVVAGYQHILMQQEGTLEKTVEALPQWLITTSEMGSGDDSTIVVAALR